MTSYLSIQQRNNVLRTMAELVNRQGVDIISANIKDVEDYKGTDLAMFDRLKIDESKIDGMVQSLLELADQEDPLGVEKYRYIHENDIEISNKTAPFGTVMIIYESRPDVTIEAAGIAFKSGNRILLKGGKEALNSNLLLVELWHKALLLNQITSDWITYLQYNRTQTQAFLANPTQRVDLIIPRGGEKLIGFVKQNASCPVIVSGRGNNFVFIDKEADQDMALDIIINAKTAKISACNALDKVLIASDIPDKENFVKRLIAMLKESNVEILVDDHLDQYKDTFRISDESVWYEEFLDYKIVLGQVKNMEEAINRINKYCGGHSSAIITQNKAQASDFMESVDSAAVYHNASIRFTDGGQFGLGGELAISTDKLHQRGPIGLTHLTTNKWFVYGKGQIRN